MTLAGSAPVYDEKAPWMAALAGLAISLAVFGFDLLGDLRRDVLDPRVQWEYTW